MPKISNGKSAKRQNRIFTAKRRKSDFKSSDWYTKAASSISAIKASNSDARETRPARMSELISAAELSSILDLDDPAQPKKLGRELLTATPQEFDPKATFCEPLANSDRPDPGGWSSRLRSQADLALGDEGRCPLSGQ